MGVDISGYCDAHKMEDQSEDGGGIRIFMNPDFPGRADEFEDMAYYGTGDDCEDISMGYGRYNAVRDRIAQLAGYPLGKYEKYGVDHDSYCVACWNGATGPFSELINFSDCEGTIGTAVSKKLAEDFAAFQAAADAVTDFHDFAKLYAGLRKIFETAARGGFVIFS